MLPEPEQVRLLAAGAVIGLGGAALFIAALCLICWLEASILSRWL